MACVLESLSGFVSQVVSTAIPCLLGALLERGLRDCVGIFGLRILLSPCFGGNRYLPNGAAVDSSSLLVSPSLAAVNYLHSNTSQAGLNLQIIVPPPIEDR